MHTIGGRPAEFKLAFGVIAFMTRASINPLRDTLEQIRDEQRIDVAHRAARGLDARYNYGYVLFHEAK